MLWLLSVSYCTSAPLIFHLSTILNCMILAINSAIT
jgi:hypothetical protein